MASSTAEELLVIARLKNEISRPLAQVKGDMRGVRTEITATGTATKAQSAELRKLQREYDATSVRLGKMGQSLSNVGARMTRDVTAPIVVGFALATKVQLANEKTQAVLANTMRKTVHATTSQITATEKWIRKTQLATGVADKDLRPAFGKLLLAHRSVNQSQHDLNIAMDVSVARHIDLTSVVQAFSKASVGNVTSLKRLGISTTDSAGRALTYDQILTKLAKTTGGSMATAANTAAGRLDRLRERSRVLGEDLGSRLIPMLDKAEGGLIHVFDFAGHAGPAGQDFLIIGGLALAALGPVLKLAGGYLKLAKAYRDWQAARAAAGAAGLAGDVGAGAALSGLGLGVAGVAAATLVAAPLAVAYVKDKNLGRRAKSYAASVMGPGVLPGATPTRRDRLNAIRAARAQLAKITPADAGIFNGATDLQGRRLSGKEQAYFAAELRKQVKTQQGAYRATESNISHLTSTMHLSRTEVERLAAAHSVDLSGSLRSVSRDMAEASAAAKQNSDAVTDQAAAYEKLKSAITGVQQGRDRLFDRFVDEKTAGLDYQAALQAARTAKTPLERQQAQIAALRAGEAWLDAGSKAGSYGPKGLNQVGFAANLSEIVRQITKNGDPAGLTAIAKSFLAQAATEDPKGAASVGNQVIQYFYGYDPTKVGAAAKAGAAEALGGSDDASGVLHAMNFRRF